MSEQDQAMVEHLAELRRRVIWTLVFFLFFLIVTFYYVGDIYRFLINDASRMFPELGEIKLTLLGPGDTLKVYFTVAGLAAIGLTIPVALYHVWQFIKPALEEREARFVRRFLPLILGVFFAGIAFGYFFVFPLLYKFLYDIGSKDFIISYTAMNYFSFMTSMVFPFGIIFEMPIAVMFLTRLGLITPKLLTKIRKYAYFTIVVIASMISPPELLSHLSVAAPMILLYEISITIAKWTWRKREKALAEAEARFAAEEAQDGV